jgi:hypothetical protein
VRGAEIVVHTSKSFWRRDDEGGAGLHQRVRELDSLGIVEDDAPLRTKLDDELQQLEIVMRSPPERDGGAAWAIRHWGR